MYSEISLELTTEQLRTVVIETLRKMPSPELSQLKSAVASTAAAMGLYSNPEESVQNNTRVVRHGFQSTPLLSGNDYGKVLEIIWDLIIEGIIRPGLGDASNHDFPWIHVTEWGTKVLSNGPQTPYDPDRYLDRLSKDVPSLDRVILTYLTESLHTFRIGSLLSSTITLGCAAEKAILMLIGVYGDTLPKTQSEKFKANTKGKMIKRQFDEFRKMLESELRARLPRELDDGLDIELTALFDFIRNQRNDAGHPTGKQVERERAYANLQVFPVYLRKVYALMGWLAANPKK
jgi:hypothetical protein